MNQTHLLVLNDKQLWVFLMIVLIGLFKEKNMNPKTYLIRGNNIFWSLTVSIANSVLDKPYSKHMSFVSHFWSGMHHKLKGTKGNEINTILCGVGHNIIILD